MDINKIIETGKKLKEAGVKYELGAKAMPPSIPSVLDCSGFVRYCFAAGGAKVPDGTYYQFLGSKKVEELKIGDVGFRYSPSELKRGTINHVGIYVGEGLWMHCNYSRNGVTIEKTDFFKHYRRFEQQKEEAYMKQKVNLKHGDKTVDVEAINEGGHRYIKVQDLWKLGFKVSGNDKEITIEKGEA